MAHPFKWAQKNPTWFNWLWGKRSYSMRCNMWKSAERKIKYNEPRLHLAYTLHVSQCILPYSAFHVLNPKTRTWIFFCRFFFLRKTSVLFLWQLWKLEFWAPRPHLLFCWSSSKEGGCWDVFFRLPVGSFSRDEVQERRSTRSASLPWRSAAGKTPATWPGRSGSTWRTRWSKGHACWWTLEEQEDI